LVISKYKFAIKKGLALTYNINKGRTK